MGTKEKRPCEFGAKCYRKNPQHFLDYSHPNKRSETEIMVDAGEAVGDATTKKKTRSSPRTKMKQTTLSFPKKCEFSSAPKGGTSDESKKKLVVKNDKKETILGKFKNSHSKNYGNATKEAEAVPLKRRRIRSVSEKDKPKVKIQNIKTRATNCFKSNDSSSELVESSEGCSFDSGTVGSTSWIFVKSSETGDPFDVEELKNKTNKEIIKTLFLVDMPADFYSFYEFCKSVNESYPFEALQICDMELVGPFDVLSGKINYSVGKELFLCHWRFYYDPPEFQTVLVTKTGLHFGYWRDDPNENPVFLASNDSDKDCTFKLEAENIFGTVLHYLNGFLKSCDPFKKVKINDLRNNLSSWAKKNKFSLEVKTSKMMARQKKVVSKAFHGAGIVVPVQPKSGVGYRPLIETDENLKRICKLIMAANDEDEKDSLWENLQALITAANIANDECDFGNSLELGINLFCMGSPVFHETIQHLLSTAYSLLNRTEFDKIITAHLKFRRKGNNLSAFKEA